MIQDKTKEILQAYAVETDSCGRWVHVKDVEVLLQKVLADCVSVANESALTGEPGEAIKKHFNLQ